jgi:hypothetical protein
MKVNIENCVRRLGDRDGGGKGRRYMVSQMIDHLKQLRDRAMNDDANAALTEFFDCYVFSDGVKFSISHVDKGDEA